MRIEDNITAPFAEAANSQIERDMLAKFSLDRVAGEILKLPHSINDIKLNPNTVLTDEVFNTSLNKLYTNFLYINAKAKILPNNFPEAQQFWFGQVNPGTMSFTRLSAADAVVSAPQSVVDSILSNPQCAEFFLRNGKRYMVVGNKDELIIGRYTNNLYTLELMHHSVAIDSGPGGGGTDQNMFKFSHISGVSVHENALYVSDSGLKKVFKYDISGLFNNNPATLDRGKVLLKQIGGKGTSYDKAKFNTCIQLRQNSEGKVYVLDYSEKNTVALNDESESSVQNTTAEFLDVKEFTVQYAGTQSIEFEAHIVSGSFYFTVGIFKNDVLVDEIPWLDNISTHNYVHSYMSFKTSLWGNKNDVIKLKMRPAKHNGAHAGGFRTNQYHKLKNLKIEDNRPWETSSIDSDASGTNAAIKIYDRNLNWEKSLFKSIDFKYNNIVDFDVDPSNSYVYVLTDRGTIFVYDAAGELKQKVLANDHLEKEEYKGIFFSSIDHNIIYVYTDRHVVKKFKRHLGKTIGKFKSLATGEIVRSNERITFATAANLANSLIKEEVYVGVSQQTADTMHLASVPRRPVMWGLNHRGQTNMPLEIIEDRLEPFSVHASFNSTFVIVPPGKIMGWGDNTYGQLDIPEHLKYGNYSPSYVEDIAVGLKHVVAVLNDGTVQSWGNNRYGQIGTPSAFLSGTQTLTARACGAGEYHTILVGSNGKCYGWGLNDTGQVDGDPTTVAPYTQNTSYASYAATSDGTIKMPDTSVSALDVECGYSHNVIIDVGDNNKVVGWGSNKDKQLQSDTINQSYDEAANSSKLVLKPTCLFHGDDVITATHADAGYAHTIALTGVWPDNRILSWGLNNSGQINGVPALNQTAAGMLSLSSEVMSGISAVAAGGFRYHSIISIICCAS